MYNNLPVRIADSVLLLLEKDEMLAMSQVSQRCRRDVFRCSRSGLYAKSPLRDISRLSSSFIVSSRDWKDVVNLGVLPRRLKLRDYRREIQEVLTSLTLRSLDSLTLSKCADLTHVDPLGDCPNLRTLHIRKCGDLTQVDRLGDCASLHTLSLDMCCNLRQVDGLGDCAALHTLSLNDCYNLSASRPARRLRVLAHAQS